MPRPEHFGAHSAAPRGSREAFAACPTDMKVGGYIICRPCFKASTAYLSTPAQPKLAQNGGQGTTASSKLGKDAARGVTVLGSEWVAGMGENL